MSDKKELQRIGRALIDIVKKANDAAGKVTDPVNKGILARVATVAATMCAAIDGSIQHDDSKTSERQAEAKEEGGAEDGGSLRVEA